MRFCRPRSSILAWRNASPKCRDLRDQFLSGIPAGRFGRPDDIKGLAVLLASDASEWITGALIPMDGGNLALNGGGSVRRTRERMAINEPRTPDISIAPCS